MGNTVAEWKFMGTSDCGNKQRAASKNTYLHFYSHLFSYGFDVPQRLLINAYILMVHHDLRIMAPADATLLLIFYPLSALAAAAAAGGDAAAGAHCTA